MKLLSEFGSRWRKELASIKVKEGKALTKEIAKNKGLNPKLEEKIADLKDYAEEWKRTFAGINNDKNYTNRPGYNKKTRDLIDLVKTENRQKRIKELSQKAKENYIKKTPVSSNSPKIISSVINPTNNNNARQAFNQRLQSVGRNSMKKELLGATAIAGVIGGIALARKVRSDKNKKRGKYRQF